MLGLASGISARHDPFVGGEMGMLFVHYWPVANAAVTLSELRVFDKLKACMSVRRCWLVIC